MGIFDFVKQGTQEMAIARPDAAKQFIVYKHPDQTVPAYAQLTVDSDECAVFFKDGRVVGILGPGRHTLQSSNIPFLGNIVDKFTGGNLFIAEVFFVKTAPVRGVKFGGTLADLEDPMTGLIVSPRIFGEFAVQVIDPATFVVQYVGQAAAGDNEQVLDWIKGQFMLGSRTVVGQLCDQEQISVLKTASMTKQIADRFLRECPELASCGLRVVQMGMFNLNFSPEDLAELKKFQSVLAEKKRDIAVAKMDVQAGTFEGQAAAARQQAVLDQKFANDSRYVQNLAGNYNNYAVGQAMIGAGAGMAQGGGDGGGGVGLMGAQMAAGAAMGAGMGRGMYGQGGPPAQVPQFQVGGGGGGGAAGPFYFSGPTGQQGPFANSQMLATALIQTMGPAAAGMTQVWAQGFDAWKPAGSVPDVAQFLPAGAPPPPPPPPPPPAPPMVVETFHVQFTDGVIQVSGLGGLKEEMTRRQANPDQVMVWKAGLPGWVPARQIVA